VHSKGSEGSKAHLDNEVRAQRRTQNEMRGQTLTQKESEGSKAHSK